MTNTTQTGENLETFISRNKFLYLFLILSPLVSIPFVEQNGMFTLEGFEIFKGGMFCISMVYVFLGSLFGLSKHYPIVAILGSFISGVLLFVTGTGTLELISAIPPGVSILAEELGPKLIVP